MASSHPSLSLDDENAAAASSPVEPMPSGVGEPVYGDAAQDAGDEVRFSIELTRIDRLKDTYSLDIRRLKGNLRSYKFLYDAIREYVCLFYLVLYLLTLCFTRRADLQS